jgi:hypothetical protein
MKKTTGACSDCAEGSLSLIQCVYDNGCEYEQCLDDADSFSDILEADCCPACADQFDTTLECFQDCLPECVYTTIVQYSACVEFHNCQDDCQEEIDAEAADAQNTVVTQLEDGSYEFDLGALGDLSTEDVECSDFEEQFSTEVCALANCCPNCIDQFEDVAECIVNEVIFGQLLESNTTCDVECGDNESVFQGFGKRQLQDVPVGGQPPGDGRSLQPPGGGQQPPGGQPGDGGPGDGIELPRPFRIFDECRNYMAAYFAIGKAELAYSAYMECLLGSVAKFADTLPIMEEGSPTAAPAEGDDESSGANEVAGSLLSVLMFNMAMKAFA